jgi:hypothetical protein
MRSVHAELATVVTLRPPNGLRASIGDSSAVCSHVRVQSNVTTTELEASLAASNFLFNMHTALYLLLLLSHTVHPCHMWCSDVCRSKPTFYTSPFCPQA